MEIKEQNLADSENNNIQDLNSSTDAVETTVLDNETLANETNSEEIVDKTTSLLENPIDEIDKDIIEVNDTITESPIAVEEKVELPENEISIENIVINEFPIEEQEIILEEISAAEDAKVLNLPDNFESFDKHQLIETLESIVHNDINQIKTAVTSI